ncbi:MAG: 1,4-alpha-glucan branching protein domain-containing protein [Candidatus Edwardsbacteria bacterium]
MKIGSFTFVLHSHLPYVLSHGSWPHGTDWLNEATAETYLPLLDTLENLVNQGISPKLTIGITPILSEQLNDDNFKDAFVDYLENKIKSALADDKEFKELAKFWQNFYTRLKINFEEKYHRDLIGAFRRLQDEGYIEIISCAATHGYLPLLSKDTSVQSQIKQGIKTYERYFGKRPKGFWLPECAYRPRYAWQSPLQVVSEEKSELRKGTDEFLSENEIDYFIVDSHLLKGGKAIGIYLDRFEALKKLWGRFAQEYQPRPEEIEKMPYEVYLVNSGSEEKKPVTIFSRDPKTGLQVWSGEWGYPGDSWYLDFHKKHFPGGHRYWRVTGPKSDLGEKLIYQPEKVEERLQENATHFVNLVKSILVEHYEKTQKAGILCAPFDAELFGHWWFEGPRWLNLVMKQISLDEEIELVTCSTFLKTVPATTVVSLPEGSWGEGGFHYIWLNEETKWTWKYVYQAEQEMEELLKDFGNNSDEKLTDILRQCARELLLLQSSDWQFLISTWSARDYAEMRFLEHYESFLRLANMARNYKEKRLVDPEDWTFLGDCEKRDSIFPDLELHWFKEIEFPIIP